MASTFDKLIEKTEDSIRSFETQRNLSKKFVAEHSTWPMNRTMFYHQENIRYYEELITLCNKFIDDLREAKDKNISNLSKYEERK